MTNIFNRVLWLIFVQFALSSCYFQAKVESTSSESGPTFALSSSVSAVSKAMSTKLTVSGLRSGYKVSVYTEPDCSYLWKNVTATSDSVEVSNSLTYGNYIFYASILDENNAPVVSCTNTGVSYIASISSGAGFPLGRINPFYNSDFAPLSVARDSSGNFYVMDSSQFMLKFNAFGIYQTAFGSVGTGNGQFNQTGDEDRIAIDSQGNIFVTDVGNSRVQKFNSQGAFISKFGTPGIGNGQFGTIYGIAIDSNNNIYVSDSNNRVQKFNSSGTYVSQFGTPGTGNGQFNSPTSIAFDSSGNIFVLDKVNYRIQKFDMNGNFLSKFGSQGAAAGQFYYQPTSMAIDSLGNIYVGEFGTHRVQKFSSAGIYISALLTQGTEDGQVTWPNNLFIDAKNNLIVADQNRIQVFDSAGTYRMSWAASYTTGASGNLAAPMGLKVSSSGKIYVADITKTGIHIFDSRGIFSSRIGSIGSSNGQFSGANYLSVDLNSVGEIWVVDGGNNRLQKFSAGGVYLSKFGTPGVGNSQFSSPFGIAIDSSDNIFVADTGNNRIQKFDSNGNFITKFGTPGIGNGQFNQPLMLAVDRSRSELYVSDHNNNRIQKFDLSGNYITQFAATSPGGLAIDSSGNIFVMNDSLMRIEKYSSAGTLIKTIGSAGNEKCQFVSVGEGLALDSSGNIYVSDYGKVIKFDSSGNCVEN